MKVNRKDSTWRLRNVFPVPVRPNEAMAVTVPTKPLSYFSGDDEPFAMGNHATAADEPIRLELRGSRDVRANFEIRKENSSRVT